MQDAPHKTVLLAAIARFLADDVLAALDTTEANKALAFRVRIAAHTLGGIARETMGEDAVDASELEALTGRPASPMTASARGQAILEARRAMVARIQDPSTPAAELEQLRGILRNIEGAKAVLGQPRFDLSDRIEA
jgi:hypothetical protein